MASADSSAEGEFEKFVENFPAAYEKKHGLKLSGDNLAERIKKYTTVYESTRGIQLAGKELWRLLLADEDLFGDVDLVNKILGDGVPRFALNEMDKWFHNAQRDVTMAMMLKVMKSYISAGAPWGRAFPAP
jgi:hypothetical protein